MTPRLPPLSLRALIAQATDPNILRILHYPDPRLKEISLPVESLDEETKDFCHRLATKAKETKNCAGLAAPQVGVLKRIIVVFLEKGIPTVMINPLIVPPSWIDGVQRSVCIQEVSEGCLSVPDKFTPVKRPSVVGVNWIGIDGQPYQQVFEGFNATLVQHEIDHLDGILFIDRISDTKRKRLVGS